MTVRPGDEVKVQGDDTVYVVRAVTRSGDYATVESKDDGSRRYTLLTHLRPACDAGFVACDAPVTDGVTVRAVIEHPLPEGTRIVAVDGRAYDLGHASPDPTLGFVYASVRNDGAHARVFASDVVRVVEKPPAVLDVVDDATLAAVCALRRAQKEERCAEAALKAAQERRTAAYNARVDAEVEAARALGIDRGDR